MTRESKRNWVLFIGAIILASAMMSLEFARFEVPNSKLYLPEITSHPVFISSFDDHMTDTEFDSVEWKTFQTTEFEFMHPEDIDVEESISTSYELCGDKFCKWTSFNLNGIGFTISQQHQYVELSSCVVNSENTSDKIKKFTEEPLLNNEVQGGCWSNLIFCHKGIKYSLLNVVFSENYNQLSTGQERDQFCSDAKKEDELKKINQSLNFY